MLVEIADSSLEKDRAKARIYARAGIAAYWIVNLEQGWIESYAEPSGESAAPTYHRRQDYGGDVEVPVLIAGAAAGTIRVRDLIPG